MLLSTHQTDDIAALCQHVVVLLEGRIAFAGAPNHLTMMADGKVWSAPERDARAELAWVASDGHIRHIGQPPPGAQLVAPTVEDGYLLLAGSAAATAADAVAS